MQDWGAVEGFCFEGTNCAWDVPRRRQRAGDPAPDQLARAADDDRRHGLAHAQRLRRGSTLRELRGAYGRRLVRRDTCGLNGFGGDNRGFVLNTRHAGERRFTFFELNAARTRVSDVWIGRGRVPTRRLLENPDLGRCRRP